MTFQKAVPFPFSPVLKCEGLGALFMPRLALRLGVRLAALRTAVAELPLHPTLQPYRKPARGGAGSTFTRSLSSQRQQCVCMFYQQGVLYITHHAYYFIFIFI